MKASLRIIAMVAAFVSGHAAEISKIDWEKMSSEEIRAKVISLESFREVTALMGEPHSTGNDALKSSVKYKIGRNFILFFSGAPENHFSKHDDLRKLRSVSLYKRIPGNDIERVWCVTKDQKPERGFRSDYVDSPPSKSEAEQGGASDRDNASNSNRPSGARPDGL